MVNCCVPFCKSKKGKTTGVSYHEFPNDLALREKWLKKISRKDFTPNDRSCSSVVCSLHFKEDDWSPGLKRRRLVPGATPSLFPEYPAYLQPKVSLTRRKISRASDDRALHDYSLFNLIPEIKEYNPDIVKKECEDNLIPENEVQVYNPNVINNCEENEVFNPNIVKVECEEIEEYNPCVVENEFEGNLTPENEVSNPDIVKKELEDPDDCPLLENPSDLLEIELKESEVPQLPDQTYPCSFCEEGFADKDTFLKHLSTHVKNSAKKEHVCPHCQFKACSSSSLCVHIQRIHTKEFKHVCRHCNKGFAVPSELRNHIKFRHSVEELDIMKSTDEGMMCELCNRLFTSPEEIEEHRRRHISEQSAKKHRCPQCDYATNYRGDLTRHLRYHKGERRFQCQLCDKAFVEKGPLKLHMRCHTGESPFVCVTCGKSFKRNIALRNHERMHSGEKPFLCDVCMRRFMTKSSFKLHTCRPDIILEDHELSS